MQKYSPRLVRTGATLDPIADGLPGWLPVILNADGDAKPGTHANSATTPSPTPTHTPTPSPTLTVTPTPPPAPRCTISLIEPENGAQFRPGQDVHFYWTSSDEPGSGYYEVRVDGESIGTATFNDDRQQWGASSRPRRRGGTPGRSS